MRRFGQIAVAALLMLTAAPMSAAHAAATGSIVLIFEENQNYGDIVGNTSRAPFINNTLIAHGSLATNYTDVAGWGSLPNYLGATSGNPHNGSPPLTRNNVFHQLQASGHSQRSYEEHMPKPCYLKGSYGAAPGNYDKDHDPEAYYSDIVSNATLCAASIRPAGTSASINSPAQLIADAGAGNLAEFNFVTPNDCNNMHSCSITTGDQWLSRVVPPLVQAGATVILTWDEGSTNSHIPFIVYGPGISHGTYTAGSNHYSLLAALEDHFGVARLGNAVGVRAIPLG